MGNSQLTTVATAQSMRLSLVRAVQLFKSTIADPVLLANGQFTWSFNYANELQKLIQPILAANPKLKQDWSQVIVRAGAPADDLFSQIRDAATSPVDGTLFNALIQVALTLPEMKDGSSSSAQMAALLNAPGTGGTKAHSIAHTALLGGTPVPPGSPPFLQAFAAANLTFHGAFQISKIAQDRCFEMTEAVCAFIRSKGGLHGRTGKPFDPDRVFVDEKNATPPATVPSVRRNSDAALGDLLLYSSHLTKAISIARDMLDHGHLLNAGVVSGVNADNPPASPDHFLPILAWEEFSQPIPHVAFAYWDPDATQSNDPQLGAAFGKLFFLAPKEAQQETANGPNSAAIAANFYKNGRFTTALQDALLRVSAKGNDSTKQHRYQVTLMFAR